METLQKESRRVRIGRLIYSIMAWLFVICVFFQVFLAGLAVFVSSSHWQDHIVFVRLFEFLPIFMLIAAFIGKLPGLMKWETAGLFIMIIIQYVTAIFHVNISVLAALHPVIAILLVWRGIILGQSAVKYWKNTKFIKKEID